MSCSITSIAHNQYTDIYPLLNINIHKHIYLLHLQDEELNRTAPRLDEETGEIIFATKNDYAAHIESKKTELEKMADMLERQRLDALNEKM